MARRVAGGQRDSPIRSAQTTDRSAARTRPSPDRDGRDVQGPGDGHDHRPGDHDRATTWRPDTRSRLILGPHTMEVQRRRRHRVDAVCAATEVPLAEDGYVMSHEHHGSGPVLPGALTQAFARLVDRMERRTGEPGHTVATTCGAVFYRSSVPRSSPASSSSSASELSGRSPRLSSIFSSASRRAPASCSESAPLTLTICSSSVRLK